MTYKQVAALLQVNYNTVISWTRPGKGGKPPILTALKLAPGTVRIRRSDMEAFIAAAAQPGESHDEAL